MDITSKYPRLIVIVMTLTFVCRIFIKPFVWPFLKTARSGAQTTLYVALEPSLADCSGWYFRYVSIARVVNIYFFMNFAVGRYSDCQLTDISEAAKDDSMARWLWLVSEKWTNLNRT